MPKNSLTAANFKVVQRRKTALYCLGCHFYTPDMLLCKDDPLAAELDQLHGDCSVHIHHYKLIK